MSSLIPPGTDLSTIPAAMPPPGLIPNFVNPETLAPAITAVSVVMMVMATFFILARLYVNAKRLTWDDYCCGIGAVLSFAYAGVVLSVNRTARHQWDVPLSFIDSKHWKLLYAQGILLGPSIFFAKISIFLLYLRIFTIKKQLRYAIYAGMVFTFCLYWINIGLESHFCAPRPGRNWDTAEIAPRCTKTVIWGLIQGVLVVVLDIYIFILPVPTIIRLKLPLKKRLGVLAVFMTAAFGIIAGICAMAYRIKLNYTEDETWVQSKLFICIIVEEYVAIIVSSMPAFASLITDMAQSTFFSSIWSRFSPRSRGSWISRKQRSSDIRSDSFAMQKLDSHSNLYGNGSSELQSKPSADEYIRRGMRTTIESTPIRENVQEGLITKETTIHHSTREHLPV